MVWKQWTQNIILTWTSNGNTRPNGLFLGSTNPRQSISDTVNFRQLTSRRDVPLIHPLVSTNHTLALDPLVQGMKKCTHGGYPLESLLVPSIPRDGSPPITVSERVSKARCASRLSSFQFDPLSCFKMVSSLQSMVLYSMPIVMLFEALKTLWHTPLRSDCLRAFFRRCTLEELRDWAKTLPWDHPVARQLDHEVHRRRMAGECYGFDFFRVWVPWPYPFFDS